MVANANKLPVICGEKGMADNSGFATYGIDYNKLGHNRPDDSEVPWWQISSTPSLSTSPRLNLEHSVVFLQVVTVEVGKLATAVVECRIDGRREGCHLAPVARGVKREELYGIATGNLHAIHCGRGVSAICAQLGRVISVTATHIELDARGIDAIKAVVHGSLEYVQLVVAQTGIVRPTNLGLVTVATDVTVIVYAVEVVSTAQPTVVIDYLTGVCAIRVLRIVLSHVIQPRAERVDVALCSIRGHIYATVGEQHGRGVCSGGIVGCHIDSVSRLIVVYREA